MMPGKKSCFYICFLKMFFTGTVSTSASHLNLKPSDTLPGCQRCTCGEQDEPACARLPEAPGAERRFHEGSTPPRPPRGFTSSRPRPPSPEFNAFSCLAAVVRRRRQHVWGEDGSRVGALKAGQRFPEQPGPPGVRRQGKEVEVGRGSRLVSCCWFSRYPYFINFYV